MSGLLALLDDVAGIAKVAATSIDDVAAAAGKAGAKTAGVIIDDAAVTPKYVQGFAPARELPIIWRIARGSFFNKIVLLLPVAMLLANFAPWLITPLLMLGGSYLCFEGAEKIFHVLFPHASHEIDEDMSIKDPGHLEEQKVKGAIKTDFILSAEIMTIALAAIEAPNVWMQAATLAVVGIGVTVAVYGSVALIVKMDDVGLYLTNNAPTPIGRGLGRGLVKFMPVLMKILSIVGTAAMLWVGGSIIIHGLEVLGFGWLGHLIHDWAYAVGHMVPAAWEGIAEWSAKAAMDGVFGVALGLLLIPLATKVIGPMIKALGGGKGASGHN
jgi:predicted DNA repair protein MutK